MLYVNAKPGILTFQAARTDLIVTPAADSKMQKDLDSPNLSVVGKASFLDGLRLHDGNPLHSTALDDDLNVLEDKCPNKDTAGRIHGKGDVKRKQTKKATASRKNTPRMDKKGRKTRTTIEMEELETSKTIHEAQQQRPKSPSQVMNSGRKKKLGYPQTSELSLLRAQRKRTAKEPGTSKSKKPQTKGDFDAGAHPQIGISTSEEEVARDDPSEISAPKKARMSTSNRGSLTDRASPKKNTSERSTKRPLDDHQWGGGRRTRQTPELELVVDAFVDYIDHYRESVDSEVIKQSISSFSSIVKEQLEEKICYSKELKVLKKNNAKVISLGKTTTKRLLDTKYELMRAERQIFLLQKEKRERELRLSDLRTGKTFLHDLSELNRQYLDYRRKNSEENETYGASALPALVLEVNRLRSTEAQLRDINKRLEKVIEQ